MCLCVRACVCARVCVCVCSPTLDHRIKASSFSARCLTLFLHTLTVRARDSLAHAASTPSPFALSPGPNPSSPSQAPLVAPVPTSHVLLEPLFHACWYVGVCVCVSAYECECVCVRVCEHVTRMGARVCAHILGVCVRVCVRVCICWCVHMCGGSSTLHHSLKNTSICSRSRPSFLRALTADARDP